MNSSAPANSASRTVGRSRASSITRTSGAVQASSAAQLNATRSVDEDDKHSGTMPGEAKKFLTAFQTLLNKHMVTEIVDMLDNYIDLEVTNRCNHQYISKLDAELESKKRELDKKDDEIAKAHEKIKQLEVQLEKEKAATAAKEKQLEKLNTEFMNTRGQLHILENYAQETRPASKTETIKHLEGIFQSAFELVDNCLSQDLDETTFLDGNWKMVKKKFPGITLPPSNSPDAKRMRVTAVLGCLAQEATRELFQPVFVTQDGDDIGTMLDSMPDLDEADWLRRLLLGTDRKQQSRNAHRRAVAVAEEVFTTVSCMLPENKQSTFSVELRKWSNKTAKLWMEYFQPLENRIAPFLLDSKNGVIGEWRPLLPSDQWLPPKNKQLNLQSVDDIAACVWPVFNTASDFAVVTKGFVVAEAQVMAAKEEDRKLAQAFAREVRPRQRRDSRNFLDRRSSIGTGGS